MAINEACQVWIEQRIKEDVHEGKDLERSVCSISSEIAAEVSRIFQTHINPEAIRAKIRRLRSRPNGRNAENVDAPAANAGDNGDKMGAAQIIQMMNGLVKSGKSSRDAAEIVSERCGKKPDAIRQAYARYKVDEYTGDATSAMQFAQMAILQLRRIKRRDVGRVNALRHVHNWITSQEGYTDG